MNTSSAFEKRSNKYVVCLNKRPDKKSEKLLLSVRRDRKWSGGAKYLISPYTYLNKCIRVQSYPHLAKNSSDSDEENGNVCERRATRAELTVHPDEQRRFLSTKRSRAILRWPYGNAPTLKEHKRERKLWQMQNREWIERSSKKMVTAT